MKAQALLALLFALAGCGAAAPRATDETTAARGRYLVNETSGVVTDEGSGAQPSTRTTAATVHPATSTPTAAGDRTESADSEGAAPRHEVVGREPFPFESMPTPRPVNTGDPCGVCR